MKTELLQSAFHDILAYGSLRMKKSKLLWMLGRSHESPSAWDLLLREWAAFGQTRPLFGLHWGDEITLSMSASEDIAARWSKARAAPAKRQMPLPLLTHLGPEGGPDPGKHGGPVTEAKAAVSLFRHASA